MIKIPMNDLSRFALAHSSALQSSFLEFVNSGMYVLGENVASFEEEWASFQNAKFAVGVSNGTDGLTLALLRAKSLNPDRAKVAIVANAGGYSLTAALRAGLQPIFIDIGDDGLMNLGHLDRKTLESLSAIVFTHLYGVIGHLEGIVSAIKELRTPPLVIEDASQAHGVAPCGGFAGQHGDLAVFSLYPTKNLGALGDAGIITTNTAETYEWLRRARNYGWHTKYHFSSEPTMNARLDELQARFLRVFLPFLPERNERRRVIAASYDDALSQSEVLRPAIRDTSRSLYHLYPVLCPSESSRQSVTKTLRERGISSDIHFPLADFRQSMGCSEWRPPDGTDNPKAEEWCNRVLSIPLFPEMTSFEVDHVCNCLSEVEF